MRNQLTRFAIAISMLLLIVPAHAAPGDLDATFGAGGKAIGPPGISGSAIAMQSDGKIVVVGSSASSGFGVLRFTTEGELDQSFGLHGVVSTTFTSIGGDFATAVVMQPDGKIVVGGRTLLASNDPSIPTYFALARYNADGTLDAGFGNGGKRVTAIGTSHDVINAIALQNDGKIVAAGSTQDGNLTHIAVARYNIDGTLDTTFGNGGKVVTRMQGLVFGSPATLASLAQAVLMQPNGGIIVIGPATWYLGRDQVSSSVTVLVRYGSDGAIDAAFSTGGRLSLPDMLANGPNAARVLPDGRILVATQDRLVRFNAQGKVDSGFGSQLIADSGFGFAGAGVDASFERSTIISGIALQPNGKVVMGGIRSNVGAPNQVAVARFAADGTVDAGFAGGLVTIANAPGSKYGDQATAIDIQPDGKIVVLGFTDATTDANGNSSVMIVRFVGDPPGPPPDSRAEPTVIEYINTEDFPGSPGGHFFYTNTPDEIVVVDSGAVGHFRRTGGSFKAGGSKPLCRFYGSVTPGPNSHFFSIEESECLFLQSLELVPTPQSVQQWNYEGLTFSETPPITTGCPDGTIPVYRYYNNAFNNGVKNAWDSNHRYGTEKVALDAFATTSGWKAEGIAFCAPK